MKRLPLFFAVAVIAAAAGFAVYEFAPHPEFQPPVAVAAAGNPMPVTLPEFSLQDRDGNLRSIQSWPGKSLIINFWATWCAPCRKEIPLLMKINRNKAAEGFQLVGVAVDVRDDVLKYAAQMRIDYPLLIGEQEGLNAVNSFGIQAVGFPFTVFTDNQHRIVALHLGEITEAQANVILNAVQRVNRGELTPIQARTAIAAAV